MPILDLNNEEKVKQYEEFLANNDHTRITQSIPWGEVKSNWEHEVVYIEEDGKIVAGMLVLIRKVMNTALLYSPRGPVCDLENIDLVNKLVDEVELIARRYNAFCLKFDPAIAESEEIRELYQQNGYKVSGNETDADLLIQPRYEFIIDLTDKTAEEILQDMNKKGRYSVRRAAREGVEITHSHSDEALEIFCRLNEQTEERKNISLRNYDYFKRLIEAYDEENVRIYLAKHEEDYLAASIVVTEGPEMFYLYAATSDKKRKLAPSYLMVYEMIRWGIEKGCKMFNLGGMPELDEKHGLYLFKTRFTGEEGIIKYIGEIDKVYKPFYYFGYSTVVPFVKNMRKKLR